MSILTNSGRVAIAQSIANEQVFLAWGTGNPAWDDEPEIEPIEAAALIAEIGRRKASIVGFCEPNDQGDIVTTDGRFLSSVSPTKYLFFRFSFDFADGYDAEIRELGVFLGTETDPALPPGQMYFTPDQITNPGTMLLLERIERVPRSPSVRTTYEAVFTI